MAELRAGGGGRGGLHLPESVVGLVDGMRAYVSGNPTPLVMWGDLRLPILRRVLALWTGDVELGDSLAMRVVSEAFLGARRGRVIRSELPWMAAVAVRGRAAILRERQVECRLGSDIEAGAHEPLDDLARQEDRERVRAAIRTLPSSYEVALTMHYVVGCTETEVAAYFKMWRGIGLPATRRILREGRAMIKLAFEGKDLRGVFPVRYLRDRKNPRNR